MATNQLRRILFFISGMGILGVLFALLLLGGGFFDGAPGGNDPVEDVSVSSFPVSTPVVNEVASEGFSSAVGVGDTAPDFTLIDLNGNRHTLSDLRGRPVILNFWATWCAPCRIEMPELQDAFERYAGDDLAILAANREEDLATVEAYFVDELGLTFTPLLDREADVANAYGVFNMPTTFFINDQGTITVVHRGPMTSEVIDGYMSETLQ